MRAWITKLEYFNRAPWLSCKVAEWKELPGPVALIMWPRLYMHISTAVGRDVCCARQGCNCWCADHFSFTLLLQRRLVSNAARTSLILVMQTLDPSHKMTLCCELWVLNVQAKKCPSCLGPSVLLHSRVSPDITWQIFFSSSRKKKCQFSLHRPQKDVWSEMGTEF